MNRKQQGDIGVAMAIAHYTKKGNVVSVPLTDNARYDLVVEVDGYLKRIQVKTSSYVIRGMYEVTLRTKGGNMSGVGTVKKISKDECDLLFVYTFDDSCYEFPVEVFDQKSTLLLGKKYEIYKL